MALLRRDFLKKAGALSVSGMIPNRLLHWNSEDKDSETGSFLIKDAQLISMDTETGYLEKASVLVKDGIIKSINREMDIPSGIEVIDAKGAILMPGLIDNHWHLWTSLLRSMAGDRKENGYFEITEKYSRHFTAQTMELAAKYAAAEAIYSGITSVNDFNHNARNPEYVMASFNALAETGLRGRVAYGGYRDLDPKTPTDFEGIKKVQMLTGSSSKFEKLQLAFGARSVDSPFLEKDWNRARALGLPIAIHVNEAGQINYLFQKGLLKDDVNIIHANKVTDEEINQIATSGAFVTMTPYTEMRIGFGFPQINRFRKAGVNLALGVDSTALSGNANLFTVMKVLQNISNAEAESEFEMLPEEALKLATIDGARLQGIENETGSIKVGKKADLILLRKNDYNFSSGNNPYHLITEAAQPANVEFVSVNGEILKKDGQLTRINREELLEEVKDSFSRLTSKVNAK